MRQPYRNPVLPGFHPDPSVCRVGDDFYLATSSFEYFPGVPIHHSRDLVNWTTIGHALTRPSQLPLAGVRSSGGIFAPTLRHHEGTFYLVTTLVDRGNFVVTAGDPAGPWSDPTWIDEDGIDPSLAFLDGRIFYTRNGPGADADHPFVYQAELTLRDGALELAAEPVVVWRGTGGIWPEAPHLYRRGGHYYLVTAEGGTAYGHSVVVARSTDPFGPFAVSPDGPLVTHSDDPRDPIQATGHADLVELEDGSTWALLLGIRPTDRHHHLGRETFLVEVEWSEDGWPRIPGGRVPVGAQGPALPRRSQPTTFVEEFDAPGLDPEWSCLRTGDPSLLHPQPGPLALVGAAATLSDAGSPAFVARPLPGFDVELEAVLSFEPGNDGEAAGLALYAHEGFHAEVVVRRGGRGRIAELVHTVAGVRTIVATRELPPASAVTLALTTDREHSVFSLDDVELGGIENVTLSAETIVAHTGRNHFTGTVVGMYATGGGRPASVPAVFERVRIRTAD